MEKKDYLSEFLPDLDLFRENLMAFDRGDLPVPKYKGFSGGFGSYAQRGGKKHMLRLRMAGGRLTKDRLKFVVDCIDKYDINYIKLTTCQAVQLHNLSADVLSEMIEGAWKAGMLTRGGGGDFPRNVMATPLTGVRPGEVFNVTPYAEAAGEYLMSFIKTKKFPRKLKVCFSNNKVNEVHATFRDLGFVAREDGKFDVYAAGGLGNNPRLGQQVGEAVEPSQVLYYIKAMVETFCTYGNYTSRGKARTRYMQETLGEEGFVRAYKEKLQEVYDSGEDLTLDVDTAAYEYNKKGDTTEISGERVIKQKQEGLYAVFYQPIGGALAPAKAKEIYETIKDMEDVELRVAPSEGLYVINLTASEAAKVLAVTDDGAKTEFDCSVACVGASICQVGLRDSQSALQKTVAEVRKADFADGVLPRVRFSGCPSSCSAHQCGAIGFRGAVKSTPEGKVPAFAIFAGGCDFQGKEVIAETGPIIAETDIPKFLTELGQIITDAGTVYAEWIKEHKGDLEALIQKYV